MYGGGGGGGYGGCGGGGGCMGYEGGDGRYDDGPRRWAEYSVGNVPEYASESLWMAPEKDGYPEVHFVVAHGIVVCVPALFDGHSSFIAFTSECVHTWRRTDLRCAGKFRPSSGRLPTPASPAASQCQVYLHRRQLRLWYTDGTWEFVPVSLPFSRLTPGPSQWKVAT